MKAPFKAGDFVRYLDKNTDKGPMEVRWCGLGKDCYNETKFKRVGKHYFNEYVILYVGEIGYDPANSVRKISKLEQVMYDSEV